MKRTRATVLLASLALFSLSATGCHRHHLARIYQVQAPPTAMVPAQTPMVIVIENGNATRIDPYAAQDAEAREEAARQAAAREEAMRQARIERERARIEAERAARARLEQERAARAQMEQERAAREAQARAAAQGRTTVIVLAPGGAAPVQGDAWFSGQ